MTSEAASARVGEDEFLAMERASETKHELWDGEVFAMAGASLAHNLIVANVVGTLRETLRDRDCVVLPSDMKVRIPTRSGYAYPDATVVCGEIAFHDDHQDVVLNPLVLVEVLSESTERFDRGRKFAGYRTLPTLQEYLLVSQSQRLIERYHRLDEGRWELADHRAGAIRLSALGVELSVDEVYLKVTLEDEDGG